MILVHQIRALCDNPILVHVRLVPLLPGFDFVAVRRKSRFIGAE
jgi:hypothetical protein